MFILLSDRVISLCADTNVTLVQEILENVSEAVIAFDAEGKLILLNHLAESILQKGGEVWPGRQAAFGMTLSELVPEQQTPLFQSVYQQVHLSFQTAQTEGFHPGLETWLSIQAFPLEGGGIGLAFWEDTLRKRTQVIVDSHSEALELALSGASLEKSLSTLVEAVERQAGHRATASIFLLSDDHSRLRFGAAPNLPQAYCDALEGIEVKENNGSCATCASLGQFVMATDIATDEKWLPFRDVALSNGLRACWSMPIFSSRNAAVIGTFSVYYPEPRSPAESDKHIAEILSRTAAILIEKDRENRALKQAEETISSGIETLLRQRRLYETVLSSSPDPLYIFDLEGRFTFVNSALLKLWGLKWEDAIGKTCHELGYEDWHADMHMREIQQVIKTRKPIRGDIPYNGAYGRRIYDYIFAPVLGENGEVEAIAGSTRDVTERYQAEEDTRKSEQRRRLALEASHSFGIFDWDIQNNSITFDERMGDMFNLTPEQSRLGVPIEHIIQYIHEDDRPRVEKAIFDNTNTGVPYNEEYRIHQLDGSIRWGCFRGHTLFNDRGEPVSFPGVGVDTTRERNAIEALQEADRRKDEFLATLAHELRNPLAPICNALHLLRSTDSSPAQQQKAYCMVERQLAHMVRLVDDLMDVSRITRGKIKLLRKPVSIQDAISFAIETVQPIIDERQHSLAVSLPDEPLVVSGDLVRLSQVFSNIINNAAKYTQNGGRIQVQAHQDEEYAEIRITDNGFGIEAEILPTIFELFSQAEEGLERSQGGLGIGLTLVKNLIELHNGSIRVTSDGADCGACFEIRLPLYAGHPDPSVPVEAPAQSSLSPARPLQILIVDDNQDAAVTMGWLLEALGHTVRITASGAETLPLMTEFVPDVAFLDIGMPDMNGYDLCMLLKAMPALAHTLFVAQTGWGQEEHRQRSKQAGFDHHLVKPVDMGDIQHILSLVR